MSTPGVNGGSPADKIQESNQPEAPENKSDDKEKYRYKGQLKGLEKLDDIHPGLGAIAEGLIMATINKMKKDQERVKRAMRGQK